MTSHAVIPEQAQAKGGLLPKIGLVVAGILIFTAGAYFGSEDIVQLPKPGQQAAVSNGLPDDLDYTSVEQVYDALRAGYDGQLDEKTLLTGLKQGLASASGDPYTEYFDPEAAKEFDNEINGSFTGVGAELGKDKNGNVEVIAPIAGFPAEKAGLRAKDVISKIDDESAAGISVNDAVKKIRGEEGTKVKLTVIRGGAQELEFTITRAQITIPSVKHEVTADNIGVITISRYGPDTGQLARQAAQEFKQKNVKGVVLDLRGNPGGLLDQAVTVSSLWLDNSQTVLEEKRDGKVIKAFRGQSRDPLLKGIPTIVLINEGSASASEITAGALKDNKVATLLGTKTYGKGSVQALERLADGSLLKITSARWFTPSGKGIDKEGIEPDQKIERSEDDFVNARDPQKDKALSDLKK